MLVGSTERELVNGHSSSSVWPAKPTSLLTGSSSARRVRIRARGLVLVGIAGERIAVGLVSVQPYFSTMIDPGEPQIRPIEI